MPGRKRFSLTFVVFTLIGYLCYSSCLSCEEGYCLVDGGCTLCSESGFILENTGNTDSIQIQLEEKSDIEGETRLEARASTPSVCPPGFTSTYKTKYVPTGEENIMEPVEKLTKCTSCAVNRKCDGNVNFGSCGTTNYNLGAENTCNSIPTGFRKNGNILDRCPLGQYRSGTSCVNCPNGSECTITGTGLSCGAEEYSPDGAWQCYQLPENTKKSGSSLVIKCQRGEYISNGQCTECKTGYYCPDGVVALKCDVGYQSTTTSCQLCPRGQRYNSSDNKCYSCTAGYYTNILNPTSCESCENLGVCNQGAIVPKLCPSSQYYNKARRTCTDIPGGKYLSYPYNVIDCPPGTYSPGRQPNCIICPAGSFCGGKGLSKATECQLNTYSYPGATKCTDCEPGYMCKSSKFHDKCPQGTYSLGKQSICTLCPAGRYCPKGFQFGDQYASYTGNTGKGIGIPCPPGHYCPKGTSYPIVCPLGTRNPSEGGGSANSCAACTGGLYCPPGSINGESCPDGYVCDKNATNGKPITCAEAKGTNEGWYRPIGTVGVLNSCKKCPAGYFCQKGATTYQGNECPEGRYCPEGSSATSLESNLCPEGYYYPYRGLKSENECRTKGFECPKGHYCPKGSAHPIKCSIGSYNDEKRRSTTCDACPGGVVCSSLALKIPIEKCPPGYYCTSTGKAYTMTPCPEGYYSDSFGATNESTCKPCPEGYVCGKASTTTTMERCPSGYYCTNRCKPLGTNPANTLKELSASENEENRDYAVFYDSQNRSYQDVFGLSTKALASAKEPTECPKGTYSYHSGLSSKSECVKCPAGFWCNEVASTFPTKSCTPGHYCPKGSENEILCPEGTYNKFFNGKSEKECLPCPKGFSCYQKGVVYPYLCRPGTYSDKEGLSDEYCKICPEGFYCNGDAYELDPENQENGGTNNDPSTTLKIESFLSTYAEGDGTGGPSTSTVNAILAGDLLNDRTFYDNILIHYGTIKPFPCKPGTYSGVGEIKCHPCIAGHYCIDEMTNTGVSETVMKNQKCPAGSYCPEGTSHYPRDIYSDLCSPGHYCPEGTEKEIKCPSGTYRKDRGAKCVDDNNNDGCLNDGCHVCPKGYYCEEGTINYLDYPCPAGHYCSEGTGSKEQHKCPSGTYYSSTGAKGEAWCILCPTGSYCPEASEDPIICPPGSFCPEGVGEPLKCPVGTYSNQEGLSSIDDCIRCPPGYYCDKLGMTNYSGPCTAGSYCYGGSYRAEPEDITPNEDENKDEEESIFDIEIEKDGIDEIVKDNNLIHIELLQFYIRELANGKIKLIKIGGRCPKGSYCRQGSIVPTPCPQGTYGDEKGLVSQDKCRGCTGGHYCLGDGHPGEKECYEGYYCGNNSNSPTQHPAGPGQYSGKGSSAAIACEKGKFNKVEAQASCFDCTKGKFCPGYEIDVKNGNITVGGLLDKVTLNDVGTVEPMECPEGTYCPGGSIYPRKCPPGTYSSAKGLQLESQCTPCKPGFICAGWGITCIEKEDGQLCDGVKKCPAGLYCLEGTSHVPKGSGSSITNGVAVMDLVWKKYTVKDPEKNEDIEKLGLDYNVVEFSHGSFKDSCIKSVDYLKKYYSSNSGICDTLDKKGIAIECIKGHYCPEGSETYLPCPIGKYNNNFGGVSEQEACKPCTPGYGCPALGTSSPIKCAAGYYCIEGSGTLTPVPLDPLSAADGSEYKGRGNICPAGHYCPEGSSRPIACENGFYSISEGAEKCTVCPAGYICNQDLFGEGLSDPGEQSIVTDNSLYKLGCVIPVECGFKEGEKCAGGLCRNIYCEEGTGYNFDVNGKNNKAKVCPEGTFSNSIRLTKGSECTLCPSGKYCPGEADDEPKDCEAGSYCSLGCCTSTCNKRVEISNDSLIIIEGDSSCSIGHYCPEGTIDEIPCRAGTYSDTAGGKSQEEDCHPCPAGQYCREGAGDLNQPPGSPLRGSVAEGYFSLGTSDIGATNKYPYNNRTTSFICEKGQYCPTVSEMYPCPQGTFNDERGKKTCKKCGNGYICPRGSMYNNTHACPKGKYCVNSFDPRLSISNNKEYLKIKNCPKGTYSNKKGIYEEAQCLDCPTSFYCDKEGLTEPTGQCDEGYLCLRGSTSPRPNDGINKKCDPTKYCPVGASKELDCPAGKICGGSVPQDCNAGYYCPGSNKKIECEPGYYCPKGSSTHFRCPTGTYNDSKKAESIEKCLLCKSGKACTKPGLTSDNFEDCAQGYYCPGGNTNPEPLETICPPGHYCPKGSDKPLNCTSGTYSDHYGSYACDVCPEGYYCRPEDSSTIYPKECPLGFYCPKGTKEPKTHVCPNGTFSWFTGLTKEEECTNCPDGLFCDNKKGEQYTEIEEFSVEIMNEYGCPEGYYCKSGVKELGDKDLCPKGHYCPGLKGNYPNTDFEPTACPPGTYSGEVGNISPNNCTICERGKFCNSTGLSEPNGNYCSDGWLCEPGSILPTPYNITVEGENISYKALYCPIGYACKNSEKKPCYNGYYSPTIGLSDCLKCPAGFTCDGTKSEPVFNLTPCSAGYYCEEGSTTKNMKKCPPGTYSYLIGLSAESECLPCPRYMYCDGIDLTNPKYCNPGYLCLSKAKKPTPTDDTGIKCPKGYYCPGVKNGKFIPPQPCPIGTYKDTEGGDSVGSCNPCPRGHYCPRIAMTNYEDDYICDDGYYCPEGANSKIPYNGENRECRKGYYCIKGEEMSCEPGTYQPNFKSSTCLDCPSGYYCPEKEMIEPKICPKGYYCPKGTKDIDNPSLKCPIGTFNNQVGMEKVEDCYYCPYGFECNEEGIIDPYKEFDPSIKDFENYENFVYICPKGYYCNPKLSVSRIPCPKGNYCPIGSSSPIPCPPGTYNRDGKASECMICPPNRTCYEQGISDPDEEKYLCPDGMWCIGGVDVKYLNDGVKSLYCIAGYKCERGKSMERCKNGYYSNKGSSECVECPEGYFCNWNLADYIRNATDSTGYYGYDDENAVYRPYYPIKCPKNSYCPKNSVLPIPCGNGTFNNLENTEDESYCIQCSPGTYCDAIMDEFSVQSLYSDKEDLDIQLSEQDYLNIIDFYTKNSEERRKECPEGYYCKYGSYMKSNLGVEVYHNIIQCPKGYYCPISSDLPIACPIGTYMKDHNLPEKGPGKSSEDSCIICPAGYYCNKKAATTVSGLCKKGYFCPKGSIYNTGSWSSTEIEDKYKDEPYDGTRCIPGHYCPDGSIEPIPCKFGYYSSTYSMVKCEICPNGYWCDDGYIDNEGGLSAKISPIICPVGKLCKHNAANGQHTIIACRNGTYNPSEGKFNDDSCIPCPLGSYCINGLIYDCPAGYYCIGSTAVNLNNEFYKIPDTSEENFDALLKELMERLPSEVVIDEYEKDPYYKNLTYVLCPKGYWCGEGTKSPDICEDNSITGHPGAKSKDECEQCPPGYICDGSSIISCPAGYYCPKNAQAINEIELISNYLSELKNSDEELWSILSNGYNITNISPDTNFNDKIPCPIGTYNDKIGGGDRQSCKYCKKGYRCDSLGLGGIDGFICDPGYYCPGYDKTEIDLINEPSTIICPKGTYSPSSGNTVKEDCIICPYNHICPEGSISPIECTKGYFCPEGSYEMQLCPLGTIYRYIDDPNIADLNDINSVCVQCPEGRYCDDEYRLSSELCYPGYVCTGGSSVPDPGKDGNYNSGGHPCSEGFYCPRGSSVPIPCPRGTYNTDDITMNLLNQGDDEVYTITAACQICPPNTFNSFTGKNSCTHCGTTSYKVYLDVEISNGMDEMQILERRAASSVKCECVGLNRVFLTGSRSCICKKGYEYIEMRNGIEIDLSNVDSSYDCIEKLFDNCLRRNQDGTCAEGTINSESDKIITINSKDQIVNKQENRLIARDNQLTSNRCGLSCNGNIGVPFTSGGVVLCECVGYTDLSKFTNNPSYKYQISDIILDYESNILEIYGFDNEDNDYVYKALMSISVNSNPLIAFDDQGRTAASNTTVPVVLIDTDGVFGSFRAIYDVKYFMDEKLAYSISEISNSERINKEENAVNPVICLPIGGGILLYTDDERGAQKFYNYNYNSLFNTNPIYDNSKILDEKSTSFVLLTFSEPGVYSFTNLVGENNYNYKLESEKQDVIKPTLLVRVLPSSNVCPSSKPEIKKDSTYIWPTSSQTHAKIGVSPTGNVVVDETETRSKVSLSGSITTGGNTTELNEGLATASDLIQEYEPLPIVSFINKILSVIIGCVMIILIICLALYMALRNKKYSKRDRTILVNNDKFFYTFDIERRNMEAMMDSSKKEVSVEIPIIKHLGSDENENEDEGSDEIDTYSIPYLPVTTSLTLTPALLDAKLQSNIALFEDLINKFKPIREELEKKELAGNNKEEKEINDEEEMEKDKNLDLPIPLLKQLYTELTENTDKLIKFTEENISKESIEDEKNKALGLLSNEDKLKLLDEKEKKIKEIEFKYKLFKPRDMKRLYLKYLEHIELEIDKFDQDRKKVEEFYNGSNILTNDLSTNMFVLLNVLSRLAHEGFDSNGETINTVRLLLNSADDNINKFKKFVKDGSLKLVNTIKRYHAYLIDQEGNIIISFLENNKNNSNIGYDKVNKVKSVYGVSVKNGVLFHPSPNGKLRVVYLDKDLDIISLIYNSCRDSNGKMQVNTIDKKFLDIDLSRYPVVEINDDNYFLFTLINNSYEVYATHEKFLFSKQLNRLVQINDSNNGEFIENSVGIVDERDFITIINLTEGSKKDENQRTGDPYNSNILYATPYTSINKSTKVNILSTNDGGNLRSKQFEEIYVTRCDVDIGEESVKLMTLQIADDNGKNNNDNNNVDNVGTNVDSNILDINNNETKKDKKKSEFEEIEREKKIINEIYNNSSIIPAFNLFYGMPILVKNKRLINEDAYTSQNDDKKGKKSKHSNNQDEDKIKDYEENNDGFIACSMLDFIEKYNNNGKNSSANGSFLIIPLHSINSDKYGVVSPNIENMDNYYNDLTKNKNIGIEINPVEQTIPTIIERLIFSSAFDFISLITDIISKSKGYLTNIEKVIKGNTRKNDNDEEIDSDSKSFSNGLDLIDVREDINASIEQLRDIDMVFAAKYKSYINLKSNKQLSKAVLQQNSINHSYSSKANINSPDYALISNILSIHTNLERSICSRKLSKLKYSKLISILEQEEKNPETIDLNSELYLLSRNFTSEILPFYSNIIESSDLVGTINKHYINAQNYFIGEISYIISQLILIKNIQLNKSREDYYMSISTIISILSNMSSLNNEVNNNMKRFLETIEETTNFNSISSKLIASYKDKPVNFGNIFIHLIPTEINEYIHELKEEVSKLCKVLSEIDKANKLMNENEDSSDENVIDISVRAKAIEDLKNVLDNTKVCLPNYKQHKTFIGYVSNLIASINSKILLLASNLDAVKDIFGQMVIIQAMNPDNQRTTYIDEDGKRKILENRDKYLNHKGDEENEEMKDMTFLEEVKDLASIGNELKIFNALDEHGDITIAKETMYGDNNQIVNKSGNYAGELPERQQIFNEKEKQQMATLVDFLIGVSSTSENEDIAEIAKKALEKGKELVVKEETKEEIFEETTGTIADPNLEDGFNIIVAKEEEIEEQVKDRHKEIELDASTQANKLKAEIEQTQRNQKYEVLSVSDPTLVKDLAENQLKVKRLIDTNVNEFVKTMHELVDGQAEQAKKEAKRKADLVHDDNVIEQQKLEIAKELEELQAEGELKDEAVLQETSANMEQENEQRLETLRTEHQNLINEYRRKALEEDPKHDFERDSNYRNLIESQTNKEKELEDILNKEKNDQIAMLREKMRLKRMRLIKSLEVKQLNMEKQKINKTQDNQQALEEAVIEHEAVQEFMNQQTAKNNENMKKLLQMEIAFTNKLKKADEEKRKDIMREYKEQVDKFQKEMESDKERQAKALRDMIENRKKNSLKKNAKSAFNDANRINNTLSLQESELNDLELAEQKISSSMQLASEMTNIRIESQIQATIKARESITTLNKGAQGGDVDDKKKKIILKGTVKAKIFDDGENSNEDDDVYDETGVSPRANQNNQPQRVQISQALASIVETYNNDIENVNNEIESSRAKQEDMLLERLKRRRENRMKQDERNKMLRNEEIKEQFKGVLDGNVIDKINGIKHKQIQEDKEHNGNGNDLDIVMDVEDEVSFDDPEEAFEKAEILKSVQNMIQQAKASPNQESQVQSIEDDPANKARQDLEALANNNAKAIEELKAKLEAQAKEEQERLEKQLKEEEEENLRVFNENRERLKKELEEKFKNNENTNEPGSPRAPSDPSNKSQAGVQNIGNIDLKLNQVMAVFTAEQDRQQMQLKKMMERRKKMKLRKAKAEAEKKKEEQIQAKINSMKSSLSEPAMEAIGQQNATDNQQVLTSQQENEIIRNTLSNLDGSSSANNSFVVINVLKEKHYKQLKQLEESFEADKQKAIEEVEEELNNKYDELFDDLSRRQKEDIESMLNDDSLISNSEGKEKLEENMKILSGQHEQEMVDLEKSKEEEVETVILERIKKLTDDFNNNKKALLNKQMNEIYLKVQEVNKEFYKTSAKASNELIERKKIELELEKRNLLLEKRLKHKEMLMNKKKEKERLKLEKKKKFEEEKQRIIEESKQKEQGLITNLLKFQIEQSEFKTIQENMKNEMRRQQEENKMKAESLLATVSNTANETKTQIDDELSRQMARMKESIKQRTAQRIRAEKEKLMKEVEMTTKENGGEAPKTMEQLQNTTDAITDRIAKLKQEYYKLNQIIKERKGEDESSHDKKDGSKSIDRVAIDTDLGIDSNKPNAENENDESELSDIDDSLDELIHSGDNENIDENIVKILDDNQDIGGADSQNKNDNKPAKFGEQSDDETTRLLSISEKLDNINKHTKELIEIADNAVKEVNKKEETKGEVLVVNNNWMVKDNAISEGIIKTALTPVQWSMLISGKNVVGNKGLMSNVDEKPLEEQVGFGETISRLTRQVSKQKLMMQKQNRDLQLRTEPVIPIQNILAEGIRRTLNSVYQILIKSRMDMKVSSIDQLSEDSFIEIEFVEAGKYKKLVKNGRCPYANFYTYKKDTQTIYLSSVLIEPETLDELGLITKVDAGDSDSMMLQPNSSHESDFTRDYSFGEYSFGNVFTSALSVALHCLAHVTAGSDDDDDTLLQGALVSVGVASSSVGEVFKGPKKSKK